MTSLYYFAAWTDSGCLLGCSHEHGTPGEAAACIACAGCYVVAVEHGVLRALTDEEERQFQCALSTAYADMPATVEPFHYDTSGYVVMVRVRFADRCAWTTWLRCETYGQALANARQGDKIVRLGSTEWTNLRRNSDATWDSNAATACLQHGDDCSAAAFSRQRTMLVLLIDFVDLVLNWLNSWEVSELERMHAKQVPVWLETLRDRMRRTLERGVVDSSERHSS